MDRKIQHLQRKTLLSAIKNQSSECAFPKRIKKNTNKHVSFIWAYLGFPDFDASVQFNVT